MQRRWRRLRDRLIGLARQLRSVFRRSQVERELDEEHRFHLEMETEKHIRAGLDPAEARRRARLAFGGVERFQEEVRQARWTAPAERLWLDTRYALRTLLRRPLFTGVVVLTLGVAIGAASTVFTLVDRLLLRPLEVPVPERLVGLEVVHRDGGSTSAVSYADYVDLRALSTDALSGLAAHNLADIALSDGDRATAALGVYASDNYFDVLGLAPALGRFFGVRESAPATAAAVAVISHASWQTRFGGDPEVIGRQIHVNGQPLTVIGVAPEGFHGALVGARPALWVPVGLAERLQPGRDIRTRTRSSWLQLFGRLAPGVEPERAEGILSVAATSMAGAFDYPESLEPAGVRVRPYKGLPPSARDDARTFLLLLLVAAGLLLLVAAVNVAGMLLARATARGREMGVRLSLGAGRARLIRQLGVEGVVLGLLGAALGAGLAALAGPALGRVEPPGAAGFALDLSVNGAVLAFALGAGVLTSLVFGLVPAFQATGGDVRAALTGGGSPSSTRLRSALVSGQVAITLVLLVSAALLVRTLQSAADTEHGFEPEGVVMAELNLRLNGYDEPRGRAFYDVLLDRLQAASELEAAAIATSIPLGLGYDQTRVRVAGHEAPDPSGFTVGFNAVTPGYFRTIRMPMRTGRVFDEAGTMPAIVINETMADRFWPDGDAVGQPLTISGRDATVAGVVPAGKYRSFSEDPQLFAYIPSSVAYMPAVIVLLRPRGPQAPAVAAFRRALAGLDPHVPAVNVTTLDRAMGQSLFLQRAAAALIGLFSALGLLLATTGTFGLLAYLVEQRRKEIGIRMAVGAGAARIVRSVVGSGLRPVAIGAVLGLLGAAVATGVLSGMLYGVGARDPVSFAAAAGLVLGAAALAAYLPARRATRVDPAAVLRVE